MRQFERAYAKIHLDRIEENMKAMQANLTPGTKMFGVVKADGYGHGAIPVAKTIEPFVFAYAVATAEEAFHNTSNSCINLESTLLFQDDILGGTSSSTQHILVDSYNIL